MPQKTFTAKRRVEADVCDGISVYNKGYLLTITQLLDQSGLSPGSNTVSHAKKRDFDLLRKAKQGLWKSTKNTESF